MIPQQTIQTVQTNKTIKERREKMGDGNVTGWLTETERLVKQDLEARGLEVTKPSWPDFFVVDKSTGEVTFVEVKSLGDRISRKQFKMMVALHSCGFKVMIAKFRSTKVSSNNYELVPFLNLSEFDLAHKVKGETTEHERKLNWKERERVMRKFSRVNKQKRMQERGLRDEEEIMERLTSLREEHPINNHKPQQIDSLDDILSNLGKIAQKPPKQRSPEEEEEIRKHKEANEKLRLQQEEEAKRWEEGRKQREEEETKKKEEEERLKKERKHQLYVEGRKRMGKAVREDIGFDGKFDHPSPFSPQPSSPPSPLSPLSPTVVDEDDTIGK